MTDKKQFNHLESYNRLKSHSQELKQKSLRQLFQDDPNRTGKFTVKTEHVYFDYTRQLISPETIRSLNDLASERGLRQKIEDMFKGEKINKTEDRAVLHTALRDLSKKQIEVDGKDVMVEVKEVLDQIERFSKEVLSGKRKGITGKKIKNIVAVGIGGSYLGPEYLAVALKPYAKKGMNLVFVANVDGTDFAEKTAELNPEKTMVVIISKTFTTAETMQNARTAKRWMQERLGNSPEVIKKHFIAVSTAKEKVEEFGIDPENMFEFWDWVGGRFSATSAVGALPLSLYLGFKNFKKILEGAYWMDQHFLKAPFEQNIPVLSGLLDIWNINFLGYKTRALLPYSQGLSKLPAHTQQVEMESNGKSVDIDGNPIDFDTGEVVFGEPGTNGQHSFYQLLHQGKQIIPADFIGFIKPQYALGKATAEEVTHHEELMTNFFAQPDALAFGKEDTNLAKKFSGNRPSSLLLLNELNPFTAGLLLAWTEHRAAVKGFIWGVNSFDQFGVELGKVLGKQHRKRMLYFHEKNYIDTTGLEPSTAVMIEAFLKKKLP